MMDFEYIYRIKYQESMLVIDRTNSMRVSVLRFYVDAYVCRALCGNILIDQSNTKQSKAVIYLNRSICSKFVCVEGQHEQKI